ncbi:hypothetical protein WOLCODRAFT_16187 [Wolfiporia cocos MD-104 SS10]|uniref:DUF6534 domain-containing protein n=1 Tax=Wolfiporia cocos (strain MD-104) TaxID=742152 RepID=A0A2H3JT78_WOLCO|nr:hypothetical protein WOLCODRAFT_16187 [Wolfiporia cocos MD-104 SS10]
MSSPTFSLDANSSSGCTFIGISVAIFLYGISCAQTAYYFKAYPKDSLALRSICSPPYLLFNLSNASLSGVLTPPEYVYPLHCFGPWESRDTAAFCHSYSIQLKRRNSIKSTYFGVRVLSIVTRATDQTFLLGRAGINRGNDTSSAIVAVELTGFGSGIGQYHLYRENGLLIVIPVISSSHRLPIPSLMGPLCTLLADIYITLMLTWILSKNKTGLERTNNTVTQLITFAITRGFFTAAIAQDWHRFTHLGQLVLYWLEIGSFPPKLYWVMFHFPEAGDAHHILLA